MYAHVYIYIYVYNKLPLPNIYICVYREREREREKASTSAGRALSWARRCCGQGRIIRNCLAQSLLPAVATLPRLEPAASRKHRFGTSHLALIEPGSPAGPSSGPWGVLVFDFQQARSRESSLTSARQHSKQLFLPTSIFVGAVLQSNREWTPFPWPLPFCIIFRSEHESCADFNTSSLPKLVVALRVPFFLFLAFCTTIVQNA